MGMNFFSDDDIIKGSIFSTPHGATEIFFTIHTNEEKSFTDELTSLHETYLSVEKKYGLSEETLVFSRFYLSDIANQKEELRHSQIFKDIDKGAVSAIQQCPVDNGSIRLLAHHIKTNNSPLNKEVFSYDNLNRRNGALIHGNYYDLFWIANFYGIGEFDSYKQTTEILQSFNRILHENDMNLLDNAVRTWLYVRDVDNHYRGMVESRRAFFKENGLTPKTRYIASTGIEGFSREVNSLVSFDAYAIKNLKPEQIVRMEALDHLSSTIKYGVTFERGTRILFGDRSHLHISGTASINEDGDVMYHLDAKRQTERTIENIRALLEPHGADIKDMAYVIAYIRNQKDRNKVIEVLEKEIPFEIPLVFLEGAVCRPAWLVELEGVAIIPDANDFPAFF